VGPWAALGETQLAVGDRAAAARSFRRAISKDRADWFPWYELALASSGAERQAAIREGLRRNPRAPELAALRGH
jgi:Flp pilus assembly protein TadD